ncbi:MAG: anthranilate phosphoribosyltransferase [Phycisphaerae bacterium]|nr:anthranilate phosphoribosyltransferase [Phycisphaerae bacterium]
MSTQDLLNKLIHREELTRDETRSLFDEIMAGQVEPQMLAAILTALATKGETVGEIVGAAEAMRACVQRVQSPVPDAIDTCGTGGDGKPTFNVSSAVAIVAAAAGATVAKHGNRSNARPSGSAEGLTALGINVEADVPTLERCLRECRVAFLYAIKLHPAMKHAGPTRRALGVRTIFNVLGPLTNPAGVKRQLLGVPRPEMVELLVEALRGLGAERAMVVHGCDGLCDLSVSGKSRVGRWDGHVVTYEDVDCGVIGAERSRLEEIFVSSPAESAATIERVLAGQPGPAREMVVFNAAAALWVAGIVTHWADGAARARQAIDTGAARETLATWRRLSAQ